MTSLEREKKVKILMLVENQVNVHEKLNSFALECEYIWLAPVKRDLYIDIGQFSIVCSNKVSIIYVDWLWICISCDRAIET